MDTQDIKNNVSNGHHWKRIGFVLLFAVILYFAMMVMWVVVAIQAVFTLVTGSTNDNLAPFSKDLAQFISHIVTFLTYNTNKLPFPFSPWGEDAAETVTTTDSEIIIEEVEIVDVDSRQQDNK
jgi:hypothetical protein